MPVTFYRCDKCRREFASREEAENCENAHLVPVSVSVKSFSLYPFPYALNIVFSNGATKTYIAEELGGWFPGGKESEAAYKSK